MRRFPCYLVSSMISRAGLICRKSPRRPPGRYRIKAARMERVAPAQPPDCEPGAAASAVHADRLERVRAARGVKAAARAEKRADELPVAGDQPSQQPGHCRHLDHPLSVGPIAISHTAPPCRLSSARSTTSSSAAKSACLAVAAWGLARNTSRLPLGSECRYPATRCRRRLRTRLRATASPTARLTTNPTRAGSSTPALTARCPTSNGRPNRLPPRIEAAKSVFLRIRDTAGSIEPHRYPGGAAQLRR